MNKTTTKKKKSKRPKPLPRPKPLSLVAAIPSALDPHQIIRRCDGEKYFGYKHAMLDDKIKSGEVPAPMALSEKGRATGWTGQMILDHHANLHKLAAERGPDYKLKRNRSKAEA